jgi:hypothetical protein
VAVAIAALYHGIDNFGYWHNLFRSRGSAGLGVPRNSVFCSPPNPSNVASVGRTFAEERVYWSTSSVTPAQRITCSNATVSPTAAEACSASLHMREDFSAHAIIVSRASESANP